MSSLDGSSPPSPCPLCQNCAGTLRHFMGMEKTGGLITGRWRHLLINPNVAAKAFRNVVVKLGSRPTLSLTDFYLG
jgi:hypothetical protein